MNFANDGTCTLKWMALVRTWGFWSPDWPFDVQYFLTVQREVHIWGRGRPLWEAEEGREKKTKVFTKGKQARWQRGHFLIYLGGAIQVKLGLLDLLASLQVADKTCSDCRNDRNTPWAKDARGCASNIVPKWSQCYGWLLPYSILP